MNSPDMTPSPRAMLDYVTGKLEALILCGELQPGTRLPEKKLAEILGISRGPLREAIRTLEGRRLLERTPNAGVRITQLSINDLEQLLVTREALEGMACRQAAEQMTTQEISNLRETAARIENCLNDEQQFIFLGNLDIDFHRQIAISSRNKWIKHLLCEDLYALLHLYRLRSAHQYGDAVTTIKEEHQAIIDCIHARDPEGAERTMRQHIRGVRDRLLAQLGCVP